MWQRHHSRGFYAHSKISVVAGDESADWVCVEVPCLDALPLNRTLYIPLSTFTYSSCAFKIPSRPASIGFCACLLDFQNWRLSLRSCSFNDHATAIKLTCLTTHPCRCSVSLRAVLKEAAQTYWSTAACPDLMIYWSVTYDMRLNSKIQNTPDFFWWVVGTLCHPVVSSRISPPRWFP